MKKTFVLAILVLSLPLAVSAHAISETHTHVINRTNDGFEPSYLKIAQGDTVTFVNDSNADIWPASNFHPTHTLYPEFDPLKGFAPGKSWSFTFQKAGLWRMHDHLSPHVTGAVEVVASGNATSSVSVASTETKPATPGFFAKMWNSITQWWHKLFSSSPKTNGSATPIDQKLLADFKSQAEQAKFTWLEKIAKDQTPEVAWAYVKAAYDTPNGVVGNPHDMAHLVGQLIFKAYGFNGLSICDPVFAFGCYHGFMEVAFDKDNPGAYASNLMKGQDSCKTLGDENSPSYWSCIHGMGHGIATYRDHDLSKSLSDCDTLDQKVRTYCHDGVFMEFMISAAPSFYKTTDPIYPCDTVEESYKVACARSQAQVMRFRLKMETPAIAKACLDTHDDTLVFHCIDAIGYYVGQTSKGDSSIVSTECKKIPDEAGAAQCMAAAAGELVFQNYAGWQTAAPKICDSLSGNYKDLCNKRVDQVKTSYDRK